MKVYVKEGECQSLIPGILGTIGFLALATVILVPCFSYDSFMEAVWHDGMGMLFGLVFFAFGLFSLYTLIKRPKRYSAILIKKSVEDYCGSQITYMTFYASKVKEGIEDMIPTKYNCYTYGNNDLVENGKYILKIKEFNWKVKAVEEDNDLENNVAKIPNMTLTPVFIALLLIFGRNSFF